MSNYFYNLDIFYEIVQYLKLKDIVSLLNCLPEIANIQDDINLDSPVVLKEDLDLEMVKKYPVFTNVTLKAISWWYIYYYRDSIHMIAPKIRKLYIDSLHFHIPIDFKHFKSLHTLEISNPWYIDILYSLKKLDIFGFVSNRMRCEFSRMKFMPELTRLYLHDAPVFDLLNVLPQMKKLQTLEFSFYQYKAPKFVSYDIVHGLVSLCPNITTLHISLTYELLKRKDYVVSLPVLECLKIRIFFEEGVYDEPNFTFISRRLGELFSVKNCPRLRQLTVQPLVLNKGDNHVCVNSMIVDLSREFEHLETLLLSERYQLTREFVLEKIKYRRPSNTIKEVHLLCDGEREDTEDLDHPKPKCPAVHIIYRPTNEPTALVHKMCYCDDQHEKLFGAVRENFPCLENFYVHPPLCYRFSPVPFFSF